MNSLHSSSEFFVTRHGTITALANFQTPKVRSIDCETQMNPRERSGSISPSIDNQGNGSLLSR